MPQTIETVWADDDGERGVGNSPQSKASVSKGEEVEKPARMLLGLIQ